MTAAPAPAIQAMRGLRGTGAAHGAVTVLNATATGVGCSLAVAAGSTATWAWVPNGFEAQTPGADDRLARALWRRLSPGAPMPGARIATRSAFPPARGLKTSSSVAGALVRAAAQAAGARWTDDEVARHAVAAARDAGITITGALDDQVAVLHGGAHLTDNRAGRVLRSLDAPAWRVAVWVPAARIPKAQAAGIDASPLRAPLEAIARRLDADSIPAAMTENGRLFARLYAAHGLPIDGRPADAAIAAGALGAGLSGTGPAVAALFERPTPLPEVPGGTWTWTRAVGAGG